MRRCGGRVSSHHHQLDLHRDELWLGLSKRRNGGVVFQNTNGGDCQGAINYKLMLNNIHINKCNKIKYYLRNIVSSVKYNMSYIRQFDIDNISFISY
jgi:hypothetical protein